MKNSRKKLIANLAIISLLANNTPLLVNAVDLDNNIKQIRNTGGIHSPISAKDYVAVSSYFKNFQIKLNRILPKTEANDLVAKQDSSNPVAGSDEEWIVMEFSIKNEGNLPIRVSDIINKDKFVRSEMSELGTTYDVIYEAKFSDSIGGDKEIKGYGNGTYSIGMLVKKGMNLPLLQVDTDMYLHTDLNYVSPGDKPVITAHDKTFLSSDTNINEEKLLFDVSANDEQDGNLTSDIKIVSNDIKEGVVGTYKVTYQVIDSDGNVGTKTIRVKIVDSQSGSGIVIHASDKTYPSTKTVLTDDELKQGVIALDANGKNITQNLKILKHNIVLGVVGSYKLTYLVTDNYGNQSIKEITVNIVPATDNNKPPTLTVVDKEFSTDHTITTSDLLESIRAFDFEDGDLTSKIEIINNTIVAGVAGTYKVTYRVSDSFGNTVTKIAYVTLKGANNTVDDLLPTITANDKVFSIHEVITNDNLLRGVAAHDKSDGNISGKVKIIANNIVEGVEGIYDVIFEVVDKDGNKTTKNIKVTIENPTVSQSSLPTITVFDKNFPKQHSITDLDLLDGITAYDTKDGDITSKIQIVRDNNYNLVKSKMPGNYSITFEVTDSDGNSSHQQMKVSISRYIYFEDIKWHWAEKSIIKFVEYGYISGYDDMTFRPDKSITRAEFVTLFNKYFGLTKKSNKVFTDTTNHWAKDAIDIAVTNGVANGITSTRFKPNLPITREEASVMIANYLNITDNKLNKLNSFSDSESVSYWAKSSVEGVLEKGYMSGYSDNTFRGKDDITRAEAVVTLLRINKK